MEAVSIYPGSMGEIIQGKFHDKDVLVSCPVNLYTKVRLYESTNPVKKLSKPKCRVFLKNIAQRWGMQNEAELMDIEVSSEIPGGKGFASSTADLCALYYSMLKLFKRDFNMEELIKGCLEIEPTDSIIFEKLTVFDYKKGSFHKEIGSYPEFNLLVFEGGNVIDTVEFNHRKLPEQNHIEDILGVLEKGVEQNDLNAISYAATESIFRNQHRLKYEILPEIMRIKDNAGGLGIIGAHSGDALGIIFDDEERLDRALETRLSAGKYKIYKLKIIKL